MNRSWLWPVRIRSAAWVSTSSIALLAVGVHHHDHEIGALAAQRLGLRLHGRRRSAGISGRSEFDMRGVPSCAAPVRPIRTPSKRDDVAVLEARQRPAVRLRQVGGKERELRLAPCA